MTILNSPNYAISLLGCEDVVVDGVRIINSFSDGIDPDCSRFVRISNCYVDSWDDAIVPKSSQALGEPRPTEFLTVTNCVLRTSCNHFKLGTESRGAFRDITLSNCVMLNCETGRPAISAIALETVDGAELERVAISNVTIRDARTPIFIRLGNRGRGMARPTPGSLSQVTISNVVATGGTMTSSITGLPGSPVRRVSLSDIRIAMEGGGQFRGLAVPEYPEKYPEATMFGPLPAYGLYVRHVEGLSLRNVKFRWVKPDERPAMIFDDAVGLDIQGLGVEQATGPLPVVWLHNSADVLLSGTRLSREAEVFLRISGPLSKKISLLGNDLRAVVRVVDVQDGAQPSSVALTGNLMRDQVAAQQ